MRRWQKMKNNLLPISNNGFKYILYTFLASLFFEILDLETLSFFSFVMIFVVVYFFRNPERELTIFDSGSVVSPVDGELISIDEIIDDKYAYKVLVHSNYTDVGVLRVPFDALVESISVENGARLSSRAKISSEINAKMEIVFSQGKLNRVKVKHVLTRSIASLIMKMSKGQSLRQSTRYGFMLNGFTEIYIPKNFRLSVNTGDKLKASESLLGFFIAIP